MEDKRKSLIDFLTNKESIWLKMTLTLTQNDKFRADDLIQEMYLHFLEVDMKKLPKKISEGYIFRFLRNKFIDGLRKSEKTVLQKSFSWYKNEDDNNEITEARIEMSNNLEKLPYLEREILLQHMEKGQRQLNRETGVCRNRLRKYKNNAINKLKEIYNEK